ncbi:hypothetical protein DFJ74DRAFT_666890 [Hyaloraphidium curvatum]|nr:hypothetical protein DFJ74DRAFT_666890 [Hyaloraphidium curvatum]
MTVGVPGETKSIFGGAITIVTPHSYLDASQIREVPDNQEVFVDMNSDDSLIVELLESVKDIDASEAATFHFNNLAEENESTTNTINRIEVLDPLTFFEVPLEQAESASMLIGEQMISKYRSHGSEAHRVAILLGVIRLRAPYSTDVLVALNRPETTEAQPMAPDALAENFRSMLRTFAIRDFNLFVPE